METTMTRRKMESENGRPARGLRVGNGLPHMAKGAMKYDLRAETPIMGWMLGTLVVHSSKMWTGAVRPG